MENNFILMAASVGHAVASSAFQCMRAGFLWPKYNNFACLHNRQDQNELQQKRWFFFAKIVICCKSIAGPLSRYTHCFWLFTLWFIDEDARFFHFFSQDNEHTEQTMLLFFQNPCTQFRTHSATLPWFSEKCRNISQLCSSVYITIFVWRKDKTNCLPKQTWAKCYHSRNKH